MGDQSDEAKARDELERVRTENQLKKMQRDEDMRKLHEQQQQQQGNMVASPQATGQGWPDNEVQQPVSRLDAVAGALRVGKAGDAAFAKSLLDSGQPRAGSAPAEQTTAADGAKSKVTGALGVRSTKPAFER
ncbi:hypothetical protein [Kribbella sp. NPDC023855]|uniref:hypothetical protein n=1 Tax=Kribbella sp. NPDC023855 TaxID=3154698 RepID=UPI0033D8C4E7